MDQIEFTFIKVPYKDARAVAKLLPRFSSGFDGATDGETTTYRVFNLRVSDLVLALLRAEGSLALQMQYPHTDG